MTDETPQISDADLLAYLDQTAAPDIRDEIEKHHELQERAEALRQEEQALKQAFFRHECPETLDLATFQQGQLPRAETGRIERHLLECPHCAHEVAIQQQFMGDPPQAPTLGERFRLGLLRLSDALTLPAPALQLRGDGDTPAVYEEEGILLTLSTMPDPQSPTLRTLVGLLAGMPAGTPVQVDLWDGAALVGSTAATPTGNFTLTGIKPGLHALILRLSGQVLHIPDLVVD